MQFPLLLFGSITSLIDLFYQENVARDIQQTFPNLGQEPGTGATAQNLYFPNIDPKIYDFIIVGAGSAGSIVARRLAEAENGKYTVALLDVGGDAPPQTFVPALLRQYLFNPNLLIRYSTVSHSSTGGLDTFNVPLGKMLGGTSNMNGMVFNRGHELDFEAWVNSTKDDSWSYRNLLKYFKKLEAYTGDFTTGDEHGIDGPITISEDANAPGQSTWYRAGVELGIPTADPNGPQRVSFTPFQYNKKKGQRASSFHAYIGSQEKLPNLHVIKYANVSEILFDENKRAVGVSYTKHGVSFIAKVSKEVILSAGTYGTPQILIKSGIGPAAHLHELNIPLLVNSSVGENLRDHIIFPTFFEIDDPDQVHGPPALSLEDAADEFLKNGTGPLTSSEGQIGQAFLSSTVAAREGFPNWPDIQYLVYRPRYPIEVTTLPENQSTVVIKATVSIGRPKSVGRVTLNPDNLASPIIDHQFYKDPGQIDREVTLEAIEKLLNIFENTLVYQKFGARFQKPNLPQCDQFEYRSRDWWWCFVRINAHTAHHAVGTCKMGHLEDPSAVVDSKLRLKGVSGVRIVDASVMPTATNANVQAAIFLLGEKGADLILADYILDRVEF